MSSRLPPWELLAAFLAVHRTGSLSSAARRLGLSQPTVRRQIEQLEQHVGAALFVRSVTGLTLIDDAEGLVSEAEAIEASVAAFVRTAGTASDKVSGVVRLTASAVFSVEILPSILTRLRVDAPDLEIELSVSNAIENILRREADVAVRLVRPEQDAVVAKRVAPVQLGFYAAAGPMAKATRKMDWTALADSGFLLLQDRDGSLEAGLASLGLQAPRRAALRTDDDLARLAALRAGLGVSVTQAAIARKYGLVRVCPDLSYTLDVWVAMHESQKNVRRVRAVFDALVQGLS